MLAARDGQVSATTMAHDDLTSDLANRGDGLVGPHRPLGQLLDQRVDQTLVAACDVGVGLAEASRRVEEGLQLRHTVERGDPIPLDGCLGLDDHPDPLRDARLPHQVADIGREAAGDQRSRPGTRRQVGPSGSADDPASGTRARSSGARRSAPAG